MIPCHSSSSLCDSVLRTHTVIMLARVMARVVLLMNTVRQEGVMCLQGLPLLACFLILYAIVSSPFMNKKQLLRSSRVTGRSLFTHTVTNTRCCWLQFNTVLGHWLLMQFCGYNSSVCLYQIVTSISTTCTPLQTAWHTRGLQGAVTVFSVVNRCETNVDMQRAEVEPKLINILWQCCDNITKK